MSSFENCHRANVKFLRSIHALFRASEKYRDVAITLSSKIDHIELEKSKGLRFGV